MHGARRYTVTTATVICHRYVLPVLRLQIWCPPLGRNVVKHGCVQPEQCPSTIQPLIQLAKHTQLETLHDAFLLRTTSIIFLMESLGLLVWRVKDNTGGHTFTNAGYCYVTSFSSC
ncbi:hypothetical protein ANCCAN_14362 [Ancylostoma caninum]|uniref:Uncharacterized protein n=1 Tax=Ancylostoma caninum TaxID=29170 RepID=A0A368G5S0_ANCCA|nr:hypothetical protein ANCCAN_14362 [Ancylostoma caninum]